MPPAVHPVDEKLPLPRLLPLALQHVLVMYAGAVAVPLIVGRALALPPEEVAYLISADLFACGLASLIQSYGLPGVGIRLPVMMGVTFASLGPMLSMAHAPDVGLLGIFGSIIAAGIFSTLVAPFVSRLLPLFPPVVTGTIILVIGISLMRVGINWAGGGQPTVMRAVNGATGLFPNPEYAQLQGLAVSGFSASSPAASSARRSASCISTRSSRPRGSASPCPSTSAYRRSISCRSSRCASSWSSS
jgi:xanthine/uracil permease